MKQEVENALKSLKNKEIILYPTDTVWGIGCDATDEEVVKKIFELKKRKERKSLIILVDSYKMLQQYVCEVPTVAINFLKTTTKPTTVIYKNPVLLAKNSIASDNTIAIRIVNDTFCCELLKRFGKPIVSTSANISNKPTPTSFKEIEPSVINAVDYVVNLPEYCKVARPSMIIKVTDNNKIEVIREG